MARKFLTFVATVSLVMTAVGCGDDPKESPKGGTGSDAPAETKDQKQWKVAQAVIDGNNQMAEALKGIKDVETAKAAAPKLQAAVDALKAAGKTMETMEEPSEAIKKRMETEFGPAVEKAQAAITAEMVRLAQLPDALKIIQPAIDSMDK